MKRFLLFAFLTIGIVGLTISTSYATALDLDIYTLNFSAAGDTLSATVNDLENVDEWQFFAQSVVAFNDLDGDDGISEGDTFDDYVAVRITGFTNVDDDDITPLLYGGTQDSTYEMTLMLKMSGYQDTDNTYVLNDLGTDEFINFYFDAGEDFSPSSYANLDTFDDGTLVEDVASILLGGGTNTDPTDITGTLSMVLDLNDVLHTVSGSNGEYFEVDENGNPFPMEWIFGIADSNNNQQNVNLTAFENKFNVDFDTDYDFFFTANNDGSFNKVVIPEPATVLLMGSGLLCLAGIARRRTFGQKA